MKPVAACLFFFLLLHGLFAQDALSIDLNNSHFKPGDTLRATCYRISKNDAPATLNLYLEHFKTKKTWKFRYPIVNNIVSFQVILGNGLPKGSYTAKFSLQDHVLALQGKITSKKNALRAITMMMQLGTDDPILTMLETTEDGNFKTGNLLFEGTAKFMFYSINKKTRLRSIQLNNYLDSAFIPATTLSQIIQIGDSLIAKDTASGKALAVNKFDTIGIMLDTVTLVTKEKSDIQKYDKAVTTGLFKTTGRLIDAANDPDLLKSTSVFNYLSRKLTGIQFEPFEGIYIITRRNALLNIYVDEQSAGLYDINSLSITNIAMIKIFDPFEGPGLTGGGGTIAIYTKSGNFVPGTAVSNVFFAEGYSPISTVWK
jgi:hypothetical protein